MIPQSWVLLVLVFAAYRVTRLIGWDDLPPIVRLRARVTGETSSLSGSVNGMANLTNEQPVVSWSYRRPLLAHFLQCAFCQGFWTSAVVYVWWLLAPASCLYALAPFAISGAVGLLAKNLDP